MIVSPPASLTAAVQNFWRSSSYFVYQSPAILKKKGEYH